MTRHFSVLALIAAISNQIQIMGPLSTSETAHLRVSAGVSAPAVVLGSPFSLVIDVTPLGNMHVYAPGKHQYRVVDVEVAARPWLQIKPTTYPLSTIYHFKPLDEYLPVYSKPFRLVRELVIAATAANRKALAGRTTVTLDATLSYQACDDRVCYMPQKVPLSWTVPLQGK
jgi:hypothetical protein